MISVAFALGQGGNFGEGAAAGGSMGFASIIGPIVVFGFLALAFRIGYNVGKKRASPFLNNKTKCKQCGLIYTQNYITCIKCGNSLAK
jgi:hypothetical protein